jgi:hypothetical protein
MANDSLVKVNRFFEDKKRLKSQFEGMREKIMLMLRMRSKDLSLAILINVKNVRKECLILRWYFVCHAYNM